MSVMIRFSFWRKMKLINLLAPDRRRRHSSINDARHPILYASLVHLSDTSSANPVRPMILSDFEC